ncbi:MAG: methyltransferase [Thaumarchaeota archaeon]|nr:methyltransferase [Nitrososphaerota archaeon]
MLPKLSLAREGSTDLLVPAESLRAKEPKTYPAFFNPAARINRDVSVGMAKVTRPSTFLDALAGIGARGVRIANEVSKSVEVTMVEFNTTSVEVAKRNAKKNRVAGRCHVIHEESNEYLHSRFGRLERFDHVDVDPFGSPASYVQGALAAAADDAIVSLTATDTAALCGAFPAVAYRRYGANVFRSEFAHETAVRVLLGFCARTGGALDTGIQPVAAHSTLHYLRVYFRVLRGAARSDQCLKDIGYVATCPACHENSVTTKSYSQSCPKCGGSVRPMGPLWIGELVDERLVEEAAKYCVELGWDGAGAALGVLAGVNRLPPYAYSMESITSREKISSVKFQDVLDSLGRSGRIAMRQPFGALGLKTDATYAEVVNAVTALAP